MNFILEQIDVVKTTIAKGITDFGMQIVAAIIIFFVGMYGIKYVVRAIERGFKKSKLDIAIAKFLTSVATVVLKGAVVFTIIYMFVPELTPIITIIGALSVGAGMALQGSLSNFIGGLLILFNKPFTIGDIIEESAYGNFGIVTDIEIFFTKLRTFDNKIIIIPNGNLANGSVINYNKLGKRRVDLTFGVGYDSDIEHVKKVITDVVKSHKLVLQDQDNIIRLNEHGDSSLNFNCFVWCKAEDYLAVRFDLLEQVKIKFDQEKIEIPYPHMDVNIINQ